MILPKPRKVTEGDCITTKGLTLTLNVSCEEYADKALELLSLFIPQCSFDMSKNADIKVEFTKDFGEESEAYTLEIKDGIADIKCSCYSGMRNALASYSKLVTINKTEICIPDVSIEDEPCATFRGVMLDLARGIKDFDELKEDIVLMAKSGYNVLHLHLFDDQGMSVRLESVPEELYLENAYTKAQMKEIVELCDILALEIIPEFDVPAHSSKTLTVLPQFKCVTDHPETDGTWTVCAAVEEVYAFCDRIIKELIDLFPGKYFHIGGDELTMEGHPYARCEWDNCVNCRALREKHNLKDMIDEYNYLINRVYDIVKKYGRKMILWSDIVDCQRPAPFPEDVILHFWRIAAPGRGPRQGCSFNGQLKFGYNAINSFYKQTYIDLEEGIINMEVDRTDPQKLAKWHWTTFPETEEKYHPQIMGSVVCAWEYGNYKQYEYYSRSFAPCAVLFADKMWNGEDIIYTDDYKVALTKTILGADTPDGFELLEKYFGDVLPPRKNELAYFDKLTCTKEEVSSAIDILDAMSKSVRTTKYREALEKIKEMI